MSFVRSLIGIWKSNEETSEHPKDPNLKTRYYKKSRQVLMDTIENLIKQNKLRGWRIVKSDEVRGEVSLTKGNSTMTVTIFKLNPIRSAIDVYCYKEGPIGDFGSSYRQILDFFKALHTEVSPEE